MDADPALDPTPAALRRAIVTGVTWKATSQIVVQLIRIGLAVTLARLLEPHQYGLAGMVLVVSAFVLLFSDLGLGNALVQRRRIDQLDASTAFWASVCVGAVSTVAGILFAGPIATFFQEPDIQPMIAVLSVSFIVRSLGLTQSALLVREMRFKSLELREMIATLLGGAVALALAIGGAGAWAIVMQQVATAIASTVLVWHYSRWWPRRTFSLRRLRTFAAFTANVFGTSLLTQLRATTDNVLVGRFLGATALGTYALAYNVILLPFNRIATPLAQVLFPAMSRVQDDLERVRGYWLRSLRMLAGIVMPSLVGLIIVAPEFIDVVLGDAWQKSVPVVQLLAIVGLLQTLQFLNPAILQALDRTTTLTAWTFFSYAVAVAAFVIGLQWGIIGVATAYAVSAVFTELGFLAITARAVRLKLTTLLGSLAGVVQAVVGMAAVILLLRFLLVSAGLGPGLRLPILALSGAAAYVLLARWRAPELIADLRSVRQPQAPEVAGGIAIESSP